MMNNRNSVGKAAFAASQYGKEKEYWLEKLSGELKKSNFPYDHFPTGMDKGETNFVNFAFPRETSSELIKLSKNIEHRLYMILVAGLVALLYKYTGNNDIIIGSPIFKQECEGEFINTVLPLRIRTNEHNTYKDLLLQGVRPTVTEATEHQNYPIETLLFQLDMPVTGEEFPLFDVVILLKNIQYKKYIRQVNPNIIFSFLRTDDGVIKGELEYNTRLYERATAERIVRCYQHVIEMAVVDIDAALSMIDILSEQEKEQLLVDFNGPRIGYPSKSTIDRLFEDQVSRIPDEIALTYEKEFLTYNRLNEEASRLASYLRMKGLKQEEPAAVMVENSLQAVVSLLAILKAGGAYLPINIEYPNERKKYMIDDCKAKLLLSNCKEAYGISGLTLIDLDDRSSYEHISAFDPGCGLHSNDLAYIMYTSGSTGTPRGVMVVHQNVIRLVKNTNFIQFKKGDRLLLTGALEFDASTFEIWGPLLNGLTLHLAEKDTILSPDKLKEAVRKNRVSMMWMTSPLFNQLMDNDIEIFAGIGNLLVGGDVLSATHISRLKRRYPRLNVINGYGPTENTTFSTTYLVEKEYRENIPIGKPIANSTAYILDGSCRPVPIGVPGELYVGGDGLSRGYMNNPELTFEKFKIINYKLKIKNGSGVLRTDIKAFGYVVNAPAPFAAHHSPIYKTGDRARWLPDGNIEFQGRFDFQVKIRGYRIEPGEIENRLRQIEYIKEAVVIDRKNKDDEKYLCGYLVLAEEEKDRFDAVELKKTLSLDLPDYMVPAHFVQLDKIPLTTNGKVDRKALPEPQISWGGAAYAAPRNPVEEKFIEIWSDVLKIEKEKIGIDSDFFELGGHSLKATILISKLNKTFDVKVPLAELFRIPTIRELAEFIKKLEKNAFSSIKAVEKKEYYELSAAQKRHYFLQDLAPDSTVYNVPFITVLRGELNIRGIEETFKELIKRHGSLRTSFRLINDEPVQQVHEEGVFSLEYYDTPGAGHMPSPRTGNADAWPLEFFRGFVKAFDLSKAPLMRVGLLKIDKKKFFLAVDMHHIITDGTSMSLLVDEFILLYQGKELPALRLQYSDYSEWQNKVVQKEMVGQQEEYWLKQFKEEIPVLALPTDYPRPAIQSFEGNTLEFQLHLGLSGELNEFLLRTGTTLFMVMLAIYNILLSKLSGQEDIVVGMPIAARRHADLEKIIGMFVNTLVLRNFPHGDQTFGEFLNDVKHRTLEAFENQEYQFEALVDKVCTRRDTGRNPLFDVMIILQNFTRAQADWSAVSEEDSLVVDNLTDDSQDILQTVKFDLILSGMETNEGMYFSIQYCTKLFKKETIERLIDYYKKITGIVLDKPGIRIFDIELLSEQEKRMVLYEFNDSQASYPIDKTLHQLFTEQAEKSPDYIALFGPCTATATDKIKEVPASVGNWSDFVDTNTLSSSFTQITYRELNEKSHRLACGLKEKGAKPEIIVGIMMERSTEMIIGILGILKSGGAYLPLDPDYPQDRINYMLADSDADVVITNGFLLIGRKSLQKKQESLRHPEEITGSPGAPISTPKDDSLAPSWAGAASPFLVEEFKKSETLGDRKNSESILLDSPDLSKSPASQPLKALSSDSLTFSPSHASDLAYIIYTSGTTGKPKGVLVKHSSAVNLAFSQKKSFNIDRYERILQFSSLCFDASVEQIFIALTSGAVLVLIDKNTLQDIFEFESYIIRQSVTHVHAVPSFLNNIQMKGTNNLKRIISGGDLCPVELAKKWIKKCSFYNKYGPTETTVTSIQIQIKEIDGHLTSLPIGKPIHNTAIYILDEWMKIVPVGVTGKMYIGGEGVARGYLNCPELTAEKFVISHWSLVIGKKSLVNSHWSLVNNKVPKITNDQCPMTDDRLYSTGDLARWLADKNIEFLGRIDSQVKIRGFRVELGEVEKRLSNHPDVKGCVVMDRGDVEAGQYLCAYIVCDREWEVSGIREFLAKELPDYMIPSYFVPIEKIPLTPNGKIDRKSLPKPGLKAGKEYQAPVNDVEVKLVELWSEILGVEKEVIGITDNFFELGGHSLKATILVSKIHKVFEVKLPLVEIFKTPRIKELAEYIKGRSKESYISIELTEEKEYYALSPAQKRLYVLQQLVTDNTSYNIPNVIPLGESIEKEKLESVFIRLIRRHESFRTSFIKVNEETFQRVHREVDFSIECCEIPGESGLAPLVSGLTKPFDLSRAPLLRVKMIMIKASGRVLFIDMHHIISDGTSRDILEREFNELHSGGELPPLRVRYKDYSEWYNGTLQQEVIKQQQSYWMKEFSGEIPALNLPTDYPRPLVQRVEGNVVNFSFNMKETSIVKGIAKKNNTTLYMSLLTLFNLVLSKLSGQEDIIIGTPIAARRHADLHNVIGMLVNTLAMRNYPLGDKVFKEFLREVKERTLEAYENQEYPFEVLVENIKVNRDISRNPIFDVMFNLMNTADYKDAIPEPEEEDSYRHIQGTSKFDMNLAAIDLGEKIFFRIEYSTSLFKPESMEKIIGYFKNILKVLSRDTGLRISEIEIMQPGEQDAVLRLSRGEEGDYERRETLHWLFESQVERTPDRIAIIGRSRMGDYRDYRGQGPDSPGQSDATGAPVQITYRQLNEKSTGLACLLRSKGVTADTIVGIMAARSVEMIIGILGIMKAGGAYLPVDSEYPEERKRYVLEDSGVQLLLVNYNMENASRCIPDHIQVIDIRDEHIYYGENNKPGHIGRGSDLVYVIYTSGSTGKPKGVMLEHLNLANLFKYQFKYTNIDCSRILQFSTISFDASFHEIFSAFLSGGQLYLVSKEIQTDIPELFKLIDKNRIKTVFLPISFLKMIFQEEEYIKSIPRCINHIQTAGDRVLVSNNFGKYLRERKVYLHNHYGPSETHVVTTFTIDPGGEIPEMPSIGRPIMNTGIYILDKSYHLLPIGAAGEMWLGGVQVGRGYLGKAELTKERFLPNPFKEGEKIYRSGDLGRWMPDGNIEFLGRIDYQVKIRGFRVELGEIENRLLRSPGVKEVVVLALEKSAAEKYICAYIVSDSELEIPGIREFLAKELPDYMIPSYFVPIERIPLTPNGKIDRKALPKPELKASKEYEAPGNEVEVRLVELWSEILGVEKEVIGITDNFFELGGHSLKATILVSKIHKAFEVKLPLVEIFKTPRIKELAAYIKGAVRDTYCGIKAVEKREYYPLSSAQLRLYILQQMTLESTAYNMPETIPLPTEFDLEKMKDTFKKLIRRHESLRTSFYMICDQPVQVVHEEVEFEIEYYKVEAEVKEGKGTPPTDSAREIIEYFVRPFDLSRSPLLRAGVLETGNGRHILLVDMHHIISDGVSHQVLVKDFQALQEGEELLPLRLQYKEFSQWQNGAKEKENLKGQEEYWLKEFEGEIPVLELPTDYPRPVIQDFEGSAIGFEISAEESAALKLLALREGCTLFMVIGAVFKILLAKCSGQEDIIVGTPTAGRRHADIEKIIGMFVNTLALRNYPGGEKGFLEFLQEIKEKTLQAYENQEYQFEDLVDKLAVNRNTGRNPIFDVMLALQNFDMPEADAAGTAAVDKEDKEEQRHGEGEYHEARQTSKFDITLTARESEQGLLFSFQYSTKLFKKETIQRLIVYFKKIISSITQEPGMKLSGVELITDEEKEQVLYDFNFTETGYPAEIFLHQLFEEQVEKTPDHIALVGMGQGQGVGARFTAFVSYRQLDESSYRLALQLKESGIKTDSIAALMMERSIVMVIGIMGILKAGGAYLPIDPGYPRERIHYILEDSEANVLITTRPQAEEDENGGVNGWEGKNIFLESFPGFSEPPSTREHPGISTGPLTSLAYIIYTSGSTGKPKGVMVEHRNAVNYTWWSAKMYVKGEALDFPLYTSIAFDLTLTSIFTPLSTGNAVWVYTEQDFPTAIEKIEAILRNYRIGVMKLTPIHLEIVREKGKEGIFRIGIKRLIVGGEELKSKLTREIYETFAEKVEIYNEYGPTEATVGCMIYQYQYDPVTEKRISVPIGRPIPNFRVYVVSIHHEYLLQPIGIPGELCISGAGVARGYLNRPGLTAEYFCSRRLGDSFRQSRPHPPYPSKSFSLKPSPSPHPIKTPLSPSPIYRSGDLARWMSDGNIEFLGRIDQQVKIRGFRIEMGEIENQLLKYPGIKASAVLAREDEKNGKYLCAYIVSDREWEVSGIREFLAKELPDYMIPSYFVPIEKIPLTPNGKIDRKSLPKPGLKAGKEYQAPGNEVEVRLVELWSEVLGVEKEVIGITDNFFELGGHSLKATILVSKIHKAFEVKLPLVEIFKTPRIKQLAAYIKGAVRDRYSGIEAVEKREYYPLSSAQLRLYILQQMALESIAYNMPEIIPLSTEFDLGKMKDTFKKLIKRHESLRTSFYMIADQPAQIVHDEVEFAIEYYEIEAEGKDGEDTPSTDSTREIIKSFVKPFDLSRVPLLRAGLLKTANGRHILLVDMHHIISDGVSHQVLVKDFLAIREGEELLPLRLQYKEFSQWQNGAKVKKNLQRQGDYWLKEFEGEIPVLELPTDYPRPVIQDFEGSAIGFEIPAEESAALKLLALREGCTLFMVIGAVFNILLAKCSGQEDIIVGTPIAGRRHADIEKIIGMFVNTLALRNYPTGEKGFLEFLHEIKEKTLQAYENQEYQFEDLVDKLAVDRNTGRNPLFDVMLALQNFNAEPADAPGTTETVDKLDKAVQSPGEGEYHDALQTSKFDITLTAIEREQGLLFSFQYCTKLFKKETIRRFIVYYKNIISMITAEPGTRICDIEVLPAEETRKLLYDLNNTKVEYPGDKTIHELFEAQVEKLPDHMALVGPCASTSIDKIQEVPARVGDLSDFIDTNVLSSSFIQITYRELAEKSYRLACELKEKGVKPEIIVGIMVERSIEMIVGILGILKSGGAYLPIDPDYPQDRVNYMLADSGVTVLITSIFSGKEVKKPRYERRVLRSFFIPKELFGQVPWKLKRWESKNDIEIILIETPTPPSPSHLPSNLPNFPLFPATGNRRPATSLAYIIYTSGTTGKPKGVLIEHASVVNLTVHQAKYFDIDTRDRIMQFNSLCFDASVEQIFIALLSGAVLVLAYKQTLLEEIEFERFVARQSITHIDVVPSFLSLINLKHSYELKRIIVGGDVCPIPLAKKWSKYCHFYNGYGPTETTVTSIKMEVRFEDIEEVLSSLPIGKPIANTRVYLLEKRMKMVPIGVPGELYIGGDGLARGYLNRPELTAEKFKKTVIRPSSLVVGGTLKTNAHVPMTNDCLYKTGDLGRWLVDGNIEFLGRIDQQVKIRGFRVEMGEIEYQLLKYPGIKASAVSAREDEKSERNLYAYIVSDSELEIPGIREFLAKELPDYMIPSYFVPIERIPLTPNGKIDRKALPKPELKASKEYEAPGNEVEVRLVELWSEILGVEKEVIGITDNFFELGGHSLKATIAVTKIQKEFNVSLPLVELFKTPTVKALARYIRDAEPGSLIPGEERLVRLKVGYGNPRNLFLVHDGTGEVDGYVEFCKHLHGEFNCWGLRADRLENLTPRNVTIRELAGAFIETMKKIQPHGPYYIAGWSLGGTIAFEMAAQLEQTDREIAFLALIDSPPPHKSVWKNVGEFNLKSELNFIKHYDIGREIDEKLKNLDETDFHRFWPLMADYLEMNNFDVEMVKKIIVENEMPVLPNYERLGIKESIYYLNVGRTLSNARARYIPEGKINIQIHYFKASQSKGIPQKQWKKHCLQPIKYYTISGDHYSIFKMPDVVEFTKIFDKVVKPIVETG